VTLRWSKRCTHLAARSSLTAVPGRVGVSLVAATLLAATGLVLGCDTTIEGRPFVNPVQATLPSFRPAPSIPTPPPTTPPSGFPQELDPDAQGSVVILAESDHTRCKITRADVQCESQFAHSPLIGTRRANNVYVTADGAVRWMVSNLVVNPAVKIDYRVYHGLGWTIVANGAGTRITNDRTGHGMFVSIGRVETY
jgi:hypothetical protein